MPESRTNLVKGIRREGLSVPLSGPLQVPPTMGDRSKRVFQPSKGAYPLVLGFGLKVPA